MRIYKTSLSAYTDPVPRNRQLYAAAKAPFRRLGRFLFWLAAPWLIALALTLAAAAAMLAYTVLTSPDALTRHAVLSLGASAIGWGLVLGCPFFLIHAFTSRRA